MYFEIILLENFLFFWTFIVRIGILVEYYAFEKLGVAFAFFVHI